MDRIPYRDVPTTNIRGVQAAHTVLVIGRTALNPDFDDNRCLQRCLILASEGGHKIVANCKIGDATVYNKWWKHPEKNKVFGVTIHKVEEAMGIRDNTPFDASEEKFAALEALLKVSLNVFEVTLLPGYTDKTKEQFDLFTCDVVYKKVRRNHVPLSLPLHLERLESTRGHSKALLVHQGLERLQASYDATK